MSDLGKLPKPKRPYVWDHAKVERPACGGPWYVWIEKGHVTKGTDVDDLLRFSAEKLSVAEGELQLTTYGGLIIIRARPAPRGTP